MSSSLLVMPTRERPVPTLRPRGVWISDTLDAAGNATLTAIDSRHRVVLERPWCDGDDLDTITEQLWAVLDAVEPEHTIRPNLTLLNGGRLDAQLQTSATPELLDRVDPICGERPLRVE